MPHYFLRNRYLPNRWPHKVRQRKNAGFPGNSGRSPVSKRGASRFAASKPDGDVLPSPPTSHLSPKKKKPSENASKPGFSNPFEKKNISYTQKKRVIFQLVSHVICFRGVLKRMVFFLREPGHQDKVQFAPPRSFHLDWPLKRHG